MKNPPLETSPKTIGGMCCCALSHKNVTIFNYKYTSKRWTKRTPFWIDTKKRPKDDDKKNTQKRTKKNPSKQSTNDDDDNDDDDNDDEKEEEDDDDDDNNIN